MKSRIVVLALLTLISCRTKQHPETAPIVGAREAIAIAYVGVPSMNIYAHPGGAGEPVTSYGYTETVSILSRNGDWVEVRTVDGSGWSRANELIDAPTVEKILKDPNPRFATTPAAVAHPGTRGEIVLEAKVNTDGEVIEVKTVSNTTGSMPLEAANAGALKQARFFPMVQNHQRVTFYYQHHVFY